jgi:diguanylate cyclase (GGDEF)-like protein
MSAYRFALPDWRGGGVGAVVVTTCVSTVVLAVTVLFFGPTVQVVTVPIVNFVMVLLLALLMTKLSRLPRLPSAAARFWRTEGWGMYCYAVGIGLDAVGIAVYRLFGAPEILIGQFLFPIAGLFVLVAMFQYPTTARTRGERITVALDATIVLVAAGAFLWYFSVSRAWVPADGFLALTRALVVPALTLVTGFAILKIAFVGAGVISRTAMAWFGLAAVAGAIGSGMNPDSDVGLNLMTQAVLGFSQISGIIGMIIQNRISADRPQLGRRSGRRKAFSVLPYGASLGAFLFLVVVLEPVLAWREVGVVAGAGLLLCAVTARQVYALRENSRLLSSNRELTEQLQHQAWYDELTGLANRALFAVRVSEAMNAPGHPHNSTAIFLIDLDDFKMVNDTKGHAAGDELLQQVARRLQAEVRVTDTVCRLGGDEFVIIATDIDPLAADALARRVVASVAQPFVLATGAVQVGASVGVAFGDVDCAEDADARTDVGDILHRADVAMYAAKAAGKSGWRVYETLPPSPLAVFA